MSRISRRTFITTGAASVAVLGTSRRAFAKKKKIRNAIVIGSGFGGAVAALRLAERGVEVTVLERGRRWDVADPTTNATFATFSSPDGRSSWLSTTANGLIPTPIGKAAGVLELVNQSSNNALQNFLRAVGVQVRNGAGVGGGSLVDNAIMLQPSQELFKAVFPKEIKYAEMVNEFYPLVRSILGHSTIPADVLAYSEYASTRANLIQAQTAGMDFGHDVEFNIDWNAVRAEKAGTRVKAALNGQSWYGLNSGAKNSVDKNYLAMAETLGAEVLPLHVVKDIIETKKDKEYQVVADLIDVNGNVVDTIEFTTQYVFFAAGATGTPAMLTRARGKGTLPRLNQYVGKYWSGNGGFLALRGGLGSFTPAQGGPCGHFQFDDLTNPTTPTSMVELVVPTDFESLALGGAPGFSLYHGAGFVPPLGSFSYDSGLDSVTLNWPNVDPQLNAFSAGVSTLLGNLNSANPGTFTAFNSEDPSYKASGGPNLTYYPLGGAAIGQATDWSGRLHGHKQLYVVDGSLVPGGSVGGVPPAWTIAALAERTMARILKGI